MRFPRKLQRAFVRVTNGGVFIASGSCVSATLVLAAIPCLAQQSPPQSVPDSHSKSSVEQLSLQEAIERARRNNPQFQSAQTDAGIAKEDRVQARNGLLPSVVYNNSGI